MPNRRSTKTLDKKIQQMTEIEIENELVGWFDLKATVNNYKAPLDALFSAPQSKFDILIIWSFKFC